MFNGDSPRISGEPVLLPSIVAFDISSLPIKLIRSKTFLSLVHIPTTMALGEINVLFFGTNTRQWLSETSGVRLIGLPICHQEAVLNGFCFLSCFFRKHLTYNGLYWPLKLMYLDLLEEIFSIRYNLISISLIF